MCLTSTGTRKQCFKYVLQTFFKQLNNYNCFEFRAQIFNKVFVELCEISEQSFRQNVLGLVYKYLLMQDFMFLAKIDTEFSKFVIHFILFAMSGSSMSEWPC